MHPDTYTKKVTFVRSVGKWFGRQPKPVKKPYGEFFQWRPFDTRQEAMLFAEIKKEGEQLTLKFE